MAAVQVRWFVFFSFYLMHGVLYYSFVNVYVSLVFAFPVLMSRHIINYVVKNFWSHESMHPHCYICSTIVYMLYVSFQHAYN